MFLMYIGHAEALHVNHSLSLNHNSILLFIEMISEMILKNTLMYGLYFINIISSSFE